MIRYLASLIASLIVLACLTANLQAQSVEDRIAALEKRFDKLEAKIDDLAVMLMATNRRLDSSNEPIAAPKAVAPTSAWGQSSMAWGQSSTASWSSASMSSCANGSCGAQSNGLLRRVFGRR